jgi:hypothetical protein
MMVAKRNKIKITKAALYFSSFALVLLMTYLFMTTQRSMDVTNQAAEQAAALSMIPTVKKKSAPADPHIPPSVDVNVGRATASVDAVKAIDTTAAMESLESSSKIATETETETETAA